MIRESLALIYIPKIAIEQVNEVSFQFKQMAIKE